MHKSRISFYVQGQSTGLGRYVLEQILFLAVGWIPSLLGIAIRGVAYRLILRMKGLAAIENGVRLAQPKNITLRSGVYLDNGVYLHACPQGIEIGENTLVMYHAVLHVYNFRGIPMSGIKIGRDCLVGEFCIIRGQGGVSIGDRVYLSPNVQILAVNHVFDDPGVPIIQQGITARGIVIEDDAWIGAGAIILDGAHVGAGSVVAAGAVVAENVAPYMIVAGVPAKPIADRRKLDSSRGKGDIVYHGSMLDLGRTQNAS